MVLIDRAAKSLVWVSSVLLLPLFVWERALTSILMQSQHYTMALIDRVYDASRVIECLGKMNSGLHREIKELKGELGPAVVATAEQPATDQEAKVEWLKTELGDSQHQLKESWGQVRALDDELLTLSRNVKDA